MEVGVAHLLPPCSEVRRAGGGGGSAPASTMSLQRDTRSSVVRQMRSTAAAALRWRGMTRHSSGTFHSGTRSVALDSVSFSAVYTACRRAPCPGMVTLFGERAPGLHRCCDQNCRSQRNCFHKGRELRSGAT